MRFMSEKKPLPLATPPKRKICPVCGKSSYSSTGIHPQCSMSQAYKLRREHLAAERKAEAENSNKDSRETDAP